MTISRARASQQGFTLIELMIVVAIIAILAGILIPNFVNARAQAQTAACESNLRSIATALELYYADNQTYPAASSADIKPDLFKGANGVFYLNNTPKDPASITESLLYKLTSTAQSGTSGAGYTIVCPGVHVGSTLAKIAPAGTTDGSVCGTACADTKLEYVSGQGLEAAP